MPENTDHETTLKAPLVFCDTETTGVVPERDQIWEFAAIRRDLDDTETVTHFFIQHDPTLRDGLPARFRADLDARYPGDDRALCRPDAAAAILEVFRATADGVKPILVGAVPSFDAAMINALLQEMPRAAGTFMEPPWHYQVVDVEALVAGFLSSANPKRSFGPPWSSNDLSRDMGVDPDNFPRHTAFGDARWARALYDAVNWHQSPDGFTEVTHV